MLFKKPTMEALHLPKASPEEKAVRDAAIEEGYKKASLVPLESAAICLEAIKLSRAVAAKGNASSISDAGVGALMARAGVEGAVLNVLINLAEVKDASFVMELKAKAAAIASEAEGEKEAALASVHRSIGA